MDKKSLFFLVFIDASFQKGIVTFNYPFGSYKFHHSNIHFFLYFAGFLQGNFITLLLTKGNFFSPMRLLYQ